MKRTGAVAARPAPLMQFIPALNPKFKAPLHLAPFVAALERSEREPVHATVSVAPRHGKTVAVRYGIARRLLLNPQTRIAFVTYAQSFAIQNSRAIRAIYEQAGGRVVKDANTLTDWRTSSTGVDDGGLWSTSIGGPVTGLGFDLIVIDDPVKSRALAESGIEREKLVDWYRDTLSTREEPGASTFVIGARWTPNDLIGHLQGEGWENITLPAISSTGEALWPQRYSVVALERIKETLGEYGWASLYMGQPFARGGRLFGDVVFYDRLPAKVRYSIGCDFAYTTRSRSDYSAAVVLAETGGVYYVDEVVRLQVKAPQFKAVLEQLSKKYYGARPLAYIGGTERGVVDMMITEGLAIDTLPASTDKFTRAQGSAAAWNAGRILVPRQAPWLDAFVSELVSFTGSGDVHDDQVDALAGAFEAIRTVEAQRERVRAHSLRNFALQVLLHFHDPPPEYAHFSERQWAALSRGATIEQVMEPAVVRLAAAAPREANGHMRTGLSPEQAEIWKRHCEGPPQPPPTPEEIQKKKENADFIAKFEAQWAKKGKTS